MKISLPCFLLYDEEIIMMDMDFSRDADLIAETTSDIIEEEWQKELATINFDILKQQIIEIIIRLRANIAYFDEMYEKKNITKGETPEFFQTKLEQKIDLIYKDFFALQNAINAYEGQQIKITYIDIDENGNRQILLFDNTAEALTTTEAQYGPYRFTKLGYTLPQHFQLLKNTLPDTTNNNLQETTKIVEKRYQEQKKIVYWISRGNKWNGYKFTNKGPINEAFAQFFLHTQPGIDYFRHDVERNVQTFVMHDTYGAKRADSLNGFLVGDASKGSTQYAIKGQYGSPQGYKEVLKLLDRINENTTHQDLKQILSDFRIITQDKAHPLIKKASQKAMTHLIKRVTAQESGQ